MSLQPSRELVLQKLRDDFPAAADEALTVLDTYGTQSWHSEKDRVHLAILMQSHGSMERLRYLVAMANRDYRDVLVGAEYPEAFAAPLNTSPEEMAAIRRRDRDQYEAWLRREGH